MKILTGHTSPETAYVVEDYPYGFRLRCKIRYWIEYKPKVGCRFVSQTTNPKRGGIWNKPKPETYCRFGAAMYLDEEGHVQWTGLGEYSDAAESQTFQKTYGEGVPEPAQLLLSKWIAAKVAYEGARKQGDPLTKGLPEARKAFTETK